MSAPLSLWERRLLADELLAELRIGRWTPLHRAKSEGGSFALHGSATILKPAVMEFYVPGNPTVDARPFLVRLYRIDYEEYVGSLAPTYDQEPWFELLRSRRRLCHVLHDGVRLNARVGTWTIRRTLELVDRAVVIPEPVFTSVELSQKLEYALSVGILTLSMLKGPQHEAPFVGNTLLGLLYRGRSGATS